MCWLIGDDIEEASCVLEEYTFNINTAKEELTLICSSVSFCHCIHSAGFPIYTNPFPNYKKNGPDFWITYPNWFLGYFGHKQ